MLTELLVLTDTEMDTLLSQNEKMTLQEYLYQGLATKVFISADESTVYLIGTNNTKTSVYLREE